MTMSIYDTYLQCKEAHPNKKVMTTGKQWEETGGNVDYTGKFTPFRLELMVSGEVAWVEAPEPNAIVREYHSVSAWSDERVAEAFINKTLYAVDNHHPSDREVTDQDVVLVTNLIEWFEAFDSDKAFVHCEEREMTEAEEFVAWGIELSGCGHTSVAPALRHAFVRMYENGVRKP